MEKHVGKAFSESMSEAKASVEDFTQVDAAPCHSIFDRRDIASMNQRQNHDLTRVFASEHDLTRVLSRPSSKR
eukprot:1648457-Rhodomonas_salina.5